MKFKIFLTFQYVILFYLGKQIFPHVSQKKKVSLYNNSPKIVFDKLCWEIFVSLVNQLFDLFLLSANTHFIFSGCLSLCSVLK